MAKFAHIIKEDFTLGIIHMEHPRFIKWYESSGYGENQIQFLDEAEDLELAQALIDMAFKEVEVGHTGGKDFPCINYEELDLSS